MGSDQIMQDELQQSIGMSEEDAEFENDDDMNVDLAGNGQSGNYKDDMEDVVGEEDDEFEELDDQDEEEEDVEENEDEGNEDNGDDNDIVEEDSGFNNDADGDLDDGVGATQTQLANIRLGLSKQNEGAEGEDDAEHEDEEDEGVGAVKIKPGETDDESEESDNESGEESEDSAAWEEPGDNEDDEDDDDEDDDDEDDGEDDDLSRAESLTVCLFCKKNEYQDPGEEFESMLVCIGCSEHAHRQCARDKKALKTSEDAAAWKCPDCTSDDAVMASEDSDEEHIPSVEEEPLPAAKRNSNASHLEANNPESHSVLSQIEVDTEPIDSSRTLRKRKSSTEGEAEEVGMSLRKRKRYVLSDTSLSALMSPNESKTPPRLLRLKISTPNIHFTIEKKTRKKLLVKFHVDKDALANILSQEPKPKKKNRGGRRPTGRPPGRPRKNRTSEVGPPLVATGFMHPFYGFFDRETDEMKGKPYGGILNEVEADTTKTLPTPDDRRRFDEAKQMAEEEWRTRVQEMQAEACMPPAGKRSKKNAGPASQIECIQFGGWEIDTWYAAPYPEEYSRNRVLYICEFCLKYMNSDYVAWRHKLKCPAKHPPGDEIYRRGSISFFEVDGRKNPVYCQNLCLLAKLFLGSKTLYYDVEPFLFYVLCEYDDHGYHFVGYFSKEKRASSQNNVSCILTLPIHQRKGYGNLLIDFSYLLTRVEEKTGSPEKPLSDMGLVSYRNYWRLILCHYVLHNVLDDPDALQGFSIKKISDDTGMTPDDVISGLEGLRFLVRDPQTGTYAFRIDLGICREVVHKWESKGYVSLNPDYLTWTPYVMGRGNVNTFELGPALNTIAPREDEDAAVTAVAADPVLPDTVPEKTKVPDAPALSATNVADTSAGELLELNVKPAEEKLTFNNESMPVSGDAATAGSNSTTDVPPTSHSQNAEKDEEGWHTKYDRIPVSRFQVFPPITARKENRRTAVSRAQSGSGYGVVRTPSTNRPRTIKRRSATALRRSSGVPKPKPRSASARKKGGTGRGPGRWPKGTKKSDYGNADSGPGFPPGWLERMKSGEDFKKTGSISEKEKLVPLGKTPPNIKRRASESSSSSIDYRAISNSAKRSSRPKARNVIEDDDEAPVAAITSDIFRAETEENNAV